MFLYEGLEVGILGGSNILWKPQEFLLYLACVKTIIFAQNILKLRLLHHQFTFCNTWPIAT